MKTSVKALVILVICVFGCDSESEPGDPLMDAEYQSRDASARDGLQVHMDALVDGLISDSAPTQDLGTPPLDMSSPTADAAPDTGVHVDGARDQSLSDQGGDSTVSPPVDAAAPIVDAAQDAAEPIVDAAEPIVDANQDVEVPIVDAAEPIVDAAADAVAPIVDAAADAIAPLADAVLDDATPDGGNAAALACPSTSHLVGEFAEWCGKVNVHRSPDGAWAVDRDCRSGCRQVAVPYCRKYWPQTTEAFEIEVSPENKPFMEAGCRVEHLRPGHTQYACCAPNE